MAESGSGPFGRRWEAWRLSSRPACPLAGDKLEVSESWEGSSTEVEWLRVRAGEVVTAVSDYSEASGRILVRNRDGVQGWLGPGCELNFVLHVVLGKRGTPRDAPFPSADARHPPWRDIGAPAAAPEVVVVPPRTKEKGPKPKKPRVAVPAQQPPQVVQPTSVLPPTRQPEPPRAPPPRGMLEPSAAPLAGAGGMGASAKAPVIVKPTIILRDNAKQEPAPAPEAPADPPEEVIGEFFLNGIPRHLNLASVNRAVADHFATFFRDHAAELNIGDIEPVEDTDEDGNIYYDICPSIESGSMAGPVAKVRVWKPHGTKIGNRGIGTLDFYSAPSMTRADILSAYDDWKAITPLSCEDCGKPVEWQLEMTTGEQVKEANEGN
eukprot:TRINITY_DN17858_c0_g1_i1.p1 TRINITY_DN17858_c0_g1~~TRINITY_DN17858_c0_g1_i1.p1  ORF type:complete len:394 (-),score=56.26 TRINITY_DN17858_c0_g1_i1:57-1193(-)